MATSGSDNFNLTRNEIIAHVLTLLGVYRPGATITTADYNFCSTQLNLLVKGWEAQGLHLWTEEEGAVFVTDGKNKYILSSSTTDKVGKDPIQTQLTADCTSTTATVTSTVGMTAADNIGLALDTNTVHWTTIVSVDSSTQITLTAAPTTTASSGNSVFTYTSAVGRPLYIKSARLQSNSGIERPIKVMGRKEFMDQPNKQSEGIINAIHYSPKVSSGDLYVWMTPGDVNECIKFTYARSIQDFDSSSDNADLPQEWFDVLTTNLAVRVASAYGKNIQKTNPELVNTAMLLLNQAQMYDIEEGSSKIVPNERYDD